MKVAIDLSSAQAGGGVTYVRELLPRLRALPGLEVGPVLVRSALAASAGEALAGAQVVDAERRTAPTSRAWRKAVAQSRPDVIYVPTELAFWRYRQPTVLAARNAMYYPPHVAEYPRSRRVRFSARRLLAMQSVRAADAVIAVSEYARSTVAHHGLKRRQGVEVIYHGGPPERPPHTYHSDTRRFLLVSNLYRYKNLHRLLTALGRIGPGWQLRVVGKFFEPEYEQSVMSLVDGLGLRAQVSFLGHRSGDELAAEYAAAEVFVWPSYAETFGHPLLEARGHGLPLLVADAASNREIAGEAAAYFDPWDEASIERAAREAIEEPIAGASLPRAYDWDLCALQTAGVLRATAR
ncbi:MAG TPA: glycosyltransferase [Acidimicrobiales bacterium]